MSIQLAPSDCGSKSGRKRRRSGSSQSKSPHGGTGSVDDEAGYLVGDFDSPHSSNAESTSDKVVGQDLRREYAGRITLMHAIYESIDQLEECFPHADVRAVLERDREDPSLSHPLIIVEDDIESVEEWEEMEDKVKEIVRSNEDDDIMIYTDVVRRR